MAKLDPRVLGANCKECPFAINGAPNRPVLGEGPQNPQGILIAERPGNTEVELGRPLVGGTGKELEASLANVGLRREQLFIVNAAACQPPEKAERGALKRAVDCCAPAFKAQLAMRPHTTPALAAGGMAAYALTGGKSAKGGVGKSRGFIRKHEGRPYIITWHPTFAYFHNPWELTSFLTDLERWSRMLRGQLRPAPTCLITDATVGDMQQLLKESPYGVAVDIETASPDPRKPWLGKNPHYAELRSIGLGNHEWGLSFRWPPATGAQRQLLFEMLKQQLTIWQNGPWFDHRILRRYGFEIGRWEDTRDERKALVTTSKLSLAYMASIYDDCEPWKEHSHKSGKAETFEDEEETEELEVEDEDTTDDEKGTDFWTPSTEEEWQLFMRYNAQDCVETMRVHGVPNTPWPGITGDVDGSGEPFHHPRIQSLYSVHKQLSETAAEMHTTGIAVDVERRVHLAALLKRRYEEELEKFVSEVKKLLGVEMFAGVRHIKKWKKKGFAGTPQQVQALLFKRHEYPELKLFSLPDPSLREKDFWTPSGEALSVGRDALILWSIDPTVSQEAKTLMKLYQFPAMLRKANSTFVSSTRVSKAIGDDERLRPGWNSCGPGTGRWSANDPNVMNIPEAREMR